MGTEIAVQDASVIALQQRAEIDMQITTAKAYPRDIVKCVDKARAIILSDPEIAESCHYVLPRRKEDGAFIEGPSVRLAEIAVGTWGNIRAGARIIDVGEQFVTAQGVTHDLENNVCVTLEVQRRITTKNGKRYGDDMIGVTCNAACAIAFRNSVFKVVPGAVIKKLHEEAKSYAIGDANDLSERRQKAVAWFIRAGLTQAELLEFLERETVAAITAKDLLDLTGIRNSLKNGEAQIEDMRGATRSSVEEIIKTARNGGAATSTPRDAVIAEIVKILRSRKIGVNQHFGKLGYASIMDVPDAELEAELNKLQSADPQDDLPFDPESHDGPTENTDAEKARLLDAVKAAVKKAGKKLTGDMFDLMLDNATEGPTVQPENMDATQLTALLKAVEGVK